MTEHVYLKCALRDIPQDLDDDGFIEWCKEQTPKFGHLIPVRKEQGRAYDSMLDRRIYGSSLMALWHGIRIEYFTRDWFDHLVEQGWIVEEKDETSLPTLSFRNWRRTIACIRCTQLM